MGIMPEALSLFLATILYYIAAFPCLLKVYFLPFPRSSGIREAKMNIIINVIRYASPFNSR